MPEVPIVIGGNRSPMDKLRMAVRAAIRGREQHEASPYKAAEAERVALDATQRFLDSFYSGTPVPVAALHLRRLDLSEVEAFAYMASNAIAGRSTALDHLKAPSVTEAEAEALDEAFGNLSPQQQRAIRLWKDQQSLRKVSSMMCMSKEGVTELLVAAYSSMRQALIGARHSP